MKSAFRIFFLIVLSAFAYSLQTIDCKYEFKENLTKQRKASKEAVEPYHYDGTKVTYINFKPSRQGKEVEVFLFGGMDYRYIINGKAMSEDVFVRIYDRDKTQDERHMLKDLKKVNGKSVVVESSELNQVYKEKTDRKSGLQKIYIDYIIPKVDEEASTSSDPCNRGAMILTTGYRY